MEPTADARREAALEIQKLAEDFEKEDAAAFRRTRIACWVVAAIVTIIILGMMVLGGDARYLGVFWLIIVGLIWAGYALSSRRQRQQTDRLRALATRRRSRSARSGASTCAPSGPACSAQRPEEADEKRSKDHNDERQRQAETPIVTEAVPAGAHDQRIALVPDGRE